MPVVFLFNRRDEQDILWLYLLGVGGNWVEAYEVPSFYTHHLSICHIPSAFDGSDSSMAGHITICCVICCMHIFACCLGLVKCGWGIECTFWFYHRLRNLRHAYFRVLLRCWWGVDLVKCWWGIEGASWFHAVGDPDCAPACPRTFPNQYERFSLFCASDHPH